jgi:hypothetical protein
MPTTLYLAKSDYILGSISHVCPATAANFSGFPFTFPYNYGCRMQVRLCRLSVNRNVVSSAVVTE